MVGSKVLEDNLGRCRLTPEDLWARVREANVLDPSTIAAVVMETTGTISVLHGDGPLDPDVLCGVAEADQIH